MGCDSSKPDDIAPTVPMSWKVEEYDMLFKILVIGDISVGKTCLMLRFCDNAYADKHITTIGVDFKIKKLTLDTGQECKLQIWDTAGHERFRSIVSTYYRGAHGIIVVYDITNKNSFVGIQKWLNEAERHANRQVKVLLLGNKTDLEQERQVSAQEAQRWVKDKEGILFIEASAKTGDNVEESFMLLIKEIVKAKVS